MRTRYWTRDHCSSKDSRRNRAAVRALKEGYLFKEKPPPPVHTGWLIDCLLFWLVVWLVGWLVGWLVRSFVRSFVCSLVRSFARSLVRLFFLFVCSSLRPFVCSFVRSLAHLLACSFAGPDFWTTNGAFSRKWLMDHVEEIFNPHPYCHIFVSYFRSF